MSRCKACFTEHTCNRPTPDAIREAEIRGAEWALEIVNESLKENRINLKIEAAAIVDAHRDKPRETGEGI